MAMTKISASFPYGMYASAYMYSEQGNGQFPLDTFLPDRFPLEYFSTVLSRTYCPLDNFPTTIIISINAYIRICIHDMYIHTAIHEYIHTYIIYAHTYIQIIFVYMRVYYVCMYVRSHMYIIHILTCTYAYIIYIHTNIHTYIH